ASLYLPSRRRTTLSSTRAFAFITAALSSTMVCGECFLVLVEVPVSADRISEYLAQFSQARTQIVEQLRRSIVGQAEVIEQILAAVFTRGHCLLVGVPGLAKTLMVSTISQILDVAFKRIQFTPDLMPSDITGTTVLDEQETGRREFRFVK